MLRCVQWSHAIELSDGLNQFGLIDDNCYKMADTIEPLMISTANKWIRKNERKEKKMVKNFLAFPVKENGAIINANNQTLKEKENLTPTLTFEVFLSPFTRKCLDPEKPC